MKNIKTFTDFGKVNEVVTKRGSDVKKDKGGVQSFLDKYVNLAGEYGLIFRF